MKFLLLNSACSPFDTAPVCPLRLHVVSVYDGHNQTWKTLLDFRAPRRIAHLDPSTFAPNQARLPERFEMLRQRRFRDNLFPHIQKTGAILRTLRAYDIGIDGDSYGVGGSVENTLHRNVFDRRMKERPHQSSSYLHPTACSKVHMF